MKYKIIKALDLAGLSVFEPVVKLVTWDEPRVQVTKIFHFIVIPILAFLVFIGLWSVIAPNHKTKSGEVPTPNVVLDAWENILTFHDREYQKMEDFKLSGENRKKALEEVISRLSALKPIIEESNLHLEKMRAEQGQIVEEKVSPIQKEYDRRKEEVKNLQGQRKEKITTMAASIGPDDKPAKEELLSEIKKDSSLKIKERETLNAFKDRMNDARSYVHLPTKKAITDNSAIMAERQYLMKRQELLSEDNRNIKIAATKDDIDTYRSEYMAASGSTLLSKAKKVIRKEDSIKRIKGSSYAKPWTFLDQIWRSLACVFVGFAIAIAIAIPIGILCGLSKIFMAAMMPLISLFKPVSPIVWLPIVFIIVGGFIDDPDNAAVHPAFLSSAITVALCSLWPTLVNTALGVASIDKDYMNVAKVLKLGFWSRLFKIVIPSALPLMFAGLRISLGVGWMVLIAAELLSSSEGIGKYVWDMFNNGSSETFAQMFVVIFIVGIVGFLLDRIMIILQRSVSFEASASTL